MDTNKKASRQDAKAQRDPAVAGQALMMG